MTSLALDTLAVCDPEPVAMEGLRSLMESIDGPRVVAIDTNVEDAVNAVRELQPSLLILDKGFGVPALTGWVRLLSTARKPVPVIVWGNLMSESEAVRFLQAGAAGVIRKSAPLAELVDCIRTVTAGGGWVKKETGVDLPPPPPARRCRPPPGGSKAQRCRMVSWHLSSFRNRYQLAHGGYQLALLRRGKHRQLLRLGPVGARHCPGEEAIAGLGA